VFTSVQGDVILKRNMCLT